MATDLLQSLERSLSEVDITTECVSLSEAPLAIADVVTEPAVGVSLDDMGISLTETPVTADSTPSELEAARTGVTMAAFGIVDYGTVICPQNDEGSEVVSLFVEQHVVVLREHDIVQNMGSVFDRLDKEIPEDYGSAVLETGPSATADMGALVQGAHGPCTVYVIVIEGT